MPEILFNAFSFLQKKLTENGHRFSNVELKISSGFSVNNLIDHLGLKDKDVEAVFINGKAGFFDDILNDGDRVALIPPGTPGPHRLLLGIRPKDK